MSQFSLIRLSSQVARSCSADLTFLHPDGVPVRDERLPDLAVLGAEPEYQIKLVSKPFGLPASASNCFAFATS